LFPKQDGLLGDAYPDSRAIFNICKKSPTQLNCAILRVLEVDFACAFANYMDLASRLGPRKER
jgi:hypothetical protein